MNKIANFWPQILLIALSFFIIWPIFLPGYFSHHDDLQVMRIFEMRKCFEDFQIPCRWVPDMGFGNGYPLFNYYPPFPYYLGALLSFVLGYIGAAKALFFIALLLGGLTMFFLAKEIFGKVPATFAAALYLFAPYRALDTYVRGAIAESFALSIIPLVFYFSLKLIREYSPKYLLGFIFSLAAFLTSHNIMSLVFMPILLIWLIYWIVKEKLKNFKQIIIGVILGFSLSAFYLIPAFWENNLVQIENLTKADLDFRVHFVTVKQLFLDRSWGYGASVWGPNDSISFQIGWPHWLFVLVTPLLLIKNKFRGVLILLYLAFLISIFMTHNKSSLIWEKIPILHFAQFPWRFLSLSIFTASLLGGALIAILKDKQQLWVMILLTALTVFLNWQFFKPNTFDYSINDQQKLSGQHWTVQQRAALLDYLPKSAKEPKEVAEDVPKIISGQAQVHGFAKTSKSFHFKTKVIKDAKIEIPTFDFPNWQVFINDKVIFHSHKNNLGRISLDLSEGEYSIKSQFRNTPIRTAANTASLISVSIIVLILKRRQSGI